MTISYFCDILDNMKTVRIKDYMKNEMKDFSIHVLYNRALPLFEDGLNPTKRKILYSALKSDFKKENKTLSLIGNVFLKTGYEHGDASLQGSIHSLVKNYMPFNNYPLLSSSKEFGSRLEPEPPAPRYTSLKLSECFEYIYENNISYLNQKFDNKLYDYFIPLLPYTFLNGETGIAIGFSCRIYPRNIKDVIKYIINYIKGEREKRDFLPFWKGFTGKIYKNDIGEYWYDIDVEVKRKTVIINEISPFFNREQFINILSKLKIDKKIDYVDESGKTPLFKITMKNINIDELKKILKLNSKISNDLINIVKDKNIIHYDSYCDYINDWVDWRIDIYKDTIKYEAGIIKEKYEYIKAKYLFIKYCMKSINFNTVNKKDYINIINKMGYDKYKDNLLNISLYNFSIDELYKIKKIGIELKNEYEKLKKSDVNVLYINDLKNILDKF